MNSYKSQYFRVKNGVKQGGVISPILFNVYIDRLLFCLQRSGLGCHISNTYMGALSYGYMQMTLHLLALVYMD